MVVSPNPPEPHAVSRAKLMDSFLGLQLQLLLVTRSDLPYGS